MIDLPNDSGLGTGLYKEIDNTTLNDTELMNDSGFRLNNPVQDLNHPVEDMNHPVEGMNHVPSFSEVRIFLFIRITIAFSP